MLSSWLLQIFYSSKEYLWTLKICITYLQCWYLSISVNMTNLFQFLGFHSGYSTSCKNKYGCRKANDPCEQKTTREAIAEQGDERQAVADWTRYSRPVDSVNVRSLVQPFILRRLKTGRTIIRDLPEKQEISVYSVLRRESRRSSIR